MKKSTEYTQSGIKQENWETSYIPLTQKQNSTRFKSKYEDIVKAIYKKSKEENKDVRDFIREWIMLFENTRVVGWNRNEFLDCCIKVEKEMKGGKQNETR
jgi:hypothetical protein